MPCSPVVNTSIYSGDAAIYFERDPETGLSVTIDTEDLHIRSVQGSSKAGDCYVSLFGDPAVMEKFRDGTTRTPEAIHQRIDNIWRKRWETHDPYAGLSVFQQDSDVFVGHVVLGHGDQPGEAELAYLFHHRFWNQGYGMQAVTALVKEYAPATIAEG